MVNPVPRDIMRLFKMAGVTDDVGEAEMANLWQFDEDGIAIEPSGGLADVITAGTRKLQYNESTGLWTFNGNLHVTGDVTVGGSFPGGGGATTLIETIDGTGLSTVDFKSFIDNALYNDYVVKWSSLVPVTDGQPLYSRISTDNGATWKQAGTDYAWKQVGWATGGGSYNNQNGATSFISILPSIGSTGGENGRGKLELGNPSNTTYTTLVSGDVGFINALARTGMGEFSGAYIGATTAVNGIQFYFASGNIEAGNFSLYGISK